MIMMDSQPSVPCHRHLPTKQHANHFSDLFMNESISCMWCHTLTESLCWNEIDIVQIGSILGQAIIVYDKLHIQTTSFDTYSYERSATASTHSV
jgi:hypothetical protein